MERFNHYKAFKTSRQSIVTIGTFDGVHIGHKKILKNLVTLAKKENLCSVLLTFFPHPRMVLQEENSIKLIHTIEERINLIKSTGIDAIIVHPFDKTFASLTAFDFVKKVLVAHLNIKKLVIGYDHRFGKNREGTFEQLQEYGHRFNFQVIEIAAQNAGPVTVSSTKIRKAILQGAIQRVNAYLSESFSLRGIVTKGCQIGQKIGFPTANIRVRERYKILPKNGVYKVQSFIDNSYFLGMLNIGFRPLYRGKNIPLRYIFLISIKICTAKSSLFIS